LVVVLVVLGLKTCVVIAVVLVEVGTALEMQTED